jgi:hypothetical protein
MNYSQQYKTRTGINPNSDPIGLLKESIAEHFAGMNVEDYVPTGVQEDYIVPFGCGKYGILLILDNNKAGKTSTAVNILRHVFWGPGESKYFDGWWNAEGDKHSTGKNLYEKWPYSTKAGRITGTVENTAEGGPIDTEILHWWPKNRYVREKRGKTYFCRYETDTAFKFDVLTYEQKPKEYEGPFLSWTWSDEPPDAKFVAPIMTRFAGGGIWLVTATPINCGAFLDIIGDLRDHGKSVYMTHHSIYESDINTGKPNHLETKRGLWTKGMIEDYVAGIPLDERPARVFGKADARSGKIYPEFEPEVHIIGAPRCPLPPFSIDSNFARSCNCFLSKDPHPKAYSAMQWWMLTPDGDFICYNEWPNYTLLGAHYDELRESMHCPYTPEQKSRFIKVLDGSRYGLKIRGRYMDPRFSDTEELAAEYTKYGLIFELPPAQAIEVQRDRIRDLLRYEKTLPVNQYNKPRLYYMPHCMNSIRAIQRHHWAESKPGLHKEEESDMFKDFVDPLRYLLAALGSQGYIAPTVKKKHVMRDDLMVESLHDTALA